jgi:peptidoglycan/LPS O-acetylase OafA/YrhL
MRVRNRLDALTGLRFLAATAIVLQHSRGTFLGDDILRPWPLDHGVSFFFVLSGFILTYVYPELPTAGSIRSFFLARAARIWPAHLATLALAGAMLVGWSTPGPLAANVLLIQAWIPLPNYYFSYNAASWSLSTELGFYLLFPLLIWRFAERWWWLLAAAAALVLGLIALPLTHASAHALLYISPLGRLFEFVLGMATALLWQRLPKLSLVRLAGRRSS